MSGIVSVGEGSVASAAGLSTEARLFNTRHELTLARRRIADLERSIGVERAWAEKRVRQSSCLSKARARYRAREARDGSLDVTVQPGALRHFPQIDQPAYRSLR